jgi:acetyl esterase/lipase
MKNYFFHSFYLDQPLVLGRAYDIMEPEEILCDTALFIVHGGGWRSGSKSSFHKIMEAFTQRGVICASTDYRLRAKDAFEQLSDIRSAYEHFVEFLRKKGLPQKVAVYGESAGAHLASLLLCASPGECGEAFVPERPWVAPVKGILQSTPAQFTPWEDIFPHIWTSMQNIAGAPYGKEPGRYERLSLKNYIRKENPVLFYAEAQTEEMFPHEYNTQLIEKHHALGIQSFSKVYKNAEHGFFYELTRWQQKELFEDILLFLQDRSAEIHP